MAEHAQGNTRDERNNMGEINNNALAANANTAAVSHQNDSKSREQHLFEESVFQDDEFVRQQQAIMLQIERESKRQHKSIATFHRRNSNSDMPSTEADHNASISCFSALATPPTTSKATPPVTSPQPISEPRSPGFDDSSGSEEFLQYLNDPSAIEEQRRIMDQIAAQQQSRSSSASPPLQLHRQQSPQLSSNPTARDMEQLTSHMEQAVLQRATSTCSSAGTSNAPKLRPTSVERCPPPPYLTPATSKAGSKTSCSTLETTTTTSTTTGYTEDSVMELYGRKKIRIKGTKNTWKDIAKGKATLVQCPSCRSILQVGSNAKLLYCTKCSEVSPIGIASSAFAGSPDDLKIARTVQEQEVNVAYARKLARSSR